MPRQLEFNGKSYQLHEAVGTGGYKSVVWRATDPFGRKRALKFAVAADYEDSGIHTEVYKAVALEQYQQFARLEDAGVITLTDRGRERQFVLFIEEWIDGRSLADYLSTHSADVTDSFLVAYVRDMCAALNALRAHGLRHDDLHERNVMLQKPPSGAMAPEWTLKIIDTGSLKQSSAPLTKPRDDHAHFVHHLCLIYNALTSKRALVRRELAMLESTRRLLASMIDDDSATSLRDPRHILAAFDSAYSRADNPRDDAQIPLSSPFEYISAEHIADDRILVDLFASCPWLPKITGPDPCLVTGPRGCGKSTIFRWLSLRAHLHKKDVTSIPAGIAGFYVSCSSDLQNRLGWISTQSLAERYRREIGHYFNLLLAREVVNTLWHISQRPDSVSQWGFGTSEEQVLHDFVAQWLSPTDLRFRGVPLIRQTLDLIEREMFHCHVQILKGRALEHTTPETFLGDLTSLLAAHVPGFKQRRITFLLDDYSTHRLPEPVQVILNRIIWERRGSHIFKLSSEKYGATLHDPNAATIDAAREMLEVDCGREFLALDELNQSRSAEHFAEELLDVRLKAAGYSGTARGLLGESKWDEGSLAKALQADRHGRLDTSYHGLGCVSALCSGDVSTLLLVYRRIFDKGRVTRETTQTVPEHVQNQAIQSVSREFLDNIRHHFPHGPQMYLITQEFGSLVGRILKEGSPIKHGKEWDPAQCPRIEVDRHYGTDEQLSVDNELLARELLRRAIFIEMEPGRSRHAFSVTLRWQLRRVYLPAFRAALSKNDAIKWRPGDFKAFLVDPKLACQVAWEKRHKRSDVEPESTRLPLE